MKKIYRTLRFLLAEWLLFKALQIMPEDSFEEYELAKLLKRYAERFGIEANHV